MQVPLLFTSHCLSMGAPKKTTVSSGMVTSSIKVRLLVHGPVNVGVAAADGMAVKMIRVGVFVGII